jgi:hypothetical protein
MELVRFPFAEHSAPRRMDDLTRLVEQPSDREQRPCPGCDKICGCPSRSTRCCCGCSARCQDAARFLSSEPDRYPIEPYVLPLVYVLASLRLVFPCWSCEGHLRPTGGLTRMPQVWFYSASTVYPELIAAHLAELTFRRTLAHAWTISVCPHTTGGATIFQIQPQQLDEAEVQAAELASLQNDLVTIADSLAPSLRALARHMLACR